MTGKEGPVDRGGMMGRSEGSTLTRDLGFQAWSGFPHCASPETPRIPTCDELTLLLAPTRLSSCPWLGHTKFLQKE